MATSTLFPSADPASKPSVAPLRPSPSIWQSMRKWQWPLFSALGAIIAIAWYLRARDPHYSSAYMDESIYILYGRMFLSRHFQPPIDHPLDYSFGWYLWPMLAAWADRIRGIVGVRELAAAMGAGIVWALYGFARRIFSPAVGLASALVVAFLGPAILVSRIATRDAGSLFFFVIGLWLFVRAWQKDTWPAWLCAALSFYAAFLCKYLIAIYFPVFAVLIFRKNRRAILGFFLPLAALCAFYGGYYYNSLVALLHYARAYGSLKAPASEAMHIYFSNRLDFWILAGLALLAVFSIRKVGPWTLALLWCGALIMPVFQLISRADYDYWKHVNYSLIFLAPLAMQGLFALLQRLGSRPYKFTAPLVVCCLSVGLGFLGNSWHIDRFVFWPNTEPIAAYFQGRLVNSDRILIDDTVLRYTFSPKLPQWQITDPFYFRYDSKIGAPAYAEAVSNGLFDYIVLDGGIGDDARRMAAAVEPSLSAHYALKLTMPEPNLGQQIRIYARQSPPAAVPPSKDPQIHISAPLSNVLVQTDRTAAVLHAKVTGISSGDYVVADVFTNRWYTQTGKIRPGAPDGSLAATIYLAGEGREQCHHIVRVRLFDPSGYLLASAQSFNVVRAEANGRTPACR